MANLCLKPAVSIPTDDLSLLYNEHRSSFLYIYLYKSQ